MLIYVKNFSRVDYTVSVILIYNGVKCGNATARRLDLLMSMGGGDNLPSIHAIHATSSSFTSSSLHIKKDILLLGFSLISIRQIRQILQNNA